MEFANVPPVLSRDYWLKERIAASVDLEEREIFSSPYPQGFERWGAGSFFERLLYQRESSVLSRYSELS